MKFEKEMLLLYGITDRAWEGKQTLYEQVEEALKGGITILQLREKNLKEEDFIREAVEIRNLCHKYNVPLIINDNVQVALKSGADGVHVGITDTPVAEIRKLTGKNFIIGATAKTVEQAKEAEKSGADYLGVGAVFPSSTKKTAIRITREELQKICSSVKIPGIKGAGMDGIAVVSAIFGAENIKEAAVELKEKAREAVYDNG